MTCMYYTITYVYFVDPDPGAPFSSNGRRGIVNVLSKGKVPQLYGDSIYYVYVVYIVCLEG